MAEDEADAKSRASGDRRFENAGAAPSIERLSEGSAPEELDYGSISASVTDYVYQNGRRYHAYNQGKYFLPNDDKEQDRLDLAHHVLTLLLDGELYLTPIENPKMVLDLGTGTGIWAMDMADKFPKAKVIGNDLSPIQPKWVAPNLEFYVDDFEEEWAFPENTFDFVHGRMIAGSVKDWPALIAQAFSKTKPGGWTEFVDLEYWAFSDDGSLKPDSPYIQYCHYLRMGAELAGRSVDVAPHLKKWMREAGYVDVKEKVYLLPLGPWPRDKKLKELGRYQWVHLVDAVEAYSLALFTRVLEWTEEEARIYQAVVLEHVRSRWLHAYNKIYFVYGRKPTEEELAAKEKKNSEGKDNGKEEVKESIEGKSQDDDKKEQSAEKAPE